MALNVEEGLNCEVLPIIDEALACFHDLALRQVWVRVQLNVFTCRNLALLLNLLTLDLIAHLMTVGKGIILSDFAQDVSLPNLSRDERLFKLEAFFLNANGDVNLDIGLVIGEQVLACQISRRRHADERKHSL